VQWPQCKMRLVNGTHSIMDILESDKFLSERFASQPPAFLEIVKVCLTSYSAALSSDLPLCSA
jgi:hypothetical protein